MELANIDTIVIKTTDFRVLDDNKLIIQPSAFNNGIKEYINSHVLFVNSSGVPLVGSHAYYNQQGQYSFELDICKLHATSSIICLKIKLSLPKFFTGSNYRADQLTSYKYLIPILEQQLKSIGIIADLRSAKFSRLDIFKNAYTDELPATYFPIFRTIGLSVAKFNEYEGETLNYKMKNTDLTVYDKVKEMNANSIRANKVPYPDITSYPNTLRTEFKYYGGATISDKIGINTFGSLSKDGMFERINKRYLDRANGQIFKYYQPTEVEILDATILDNLIDYFMFPNGVYNPNWLMNLKNWVFTTRLPFNRKEFISVATQRYNEYRLKQGLPKDYNVKSSLNKKFTKSDIDSLLLSKVTTGKSYQVLFEELKFKLVG